MVDMLGRKVRGIQLARELELPCFGRSFLVLPYRSRGYLVEPHHILDGADPSLGRTLNYALREGKVAVVVENQLLALHPDDFYLEGEDEGYEECGKKEDGTA
jgi:hypothetical protein